ncbi:hypothetical protein JCM10213_004063 [Rhodosporidiobolus nylandii]
MVLETVYVARHGFRLSWETNTWTSPTGIPRDPPLSAHGVDQAKELAAFLEKELGIEEGMSEEERKARIEGTWVLSSPLYRCCQTATPTASTLSLPLLVEPALGEWYLPVRRGLHPELAKSSFLQQFFPAIPASPDWEPLLIPPRTGESIRALHARCATLLPRLIHALEAKGAKRVILFSHAATCIALSRALAGDLPKELLDTPEAQPGKAEALGNWKDEERLSVRAATCSVSKFTRKPDGEGWEREWDGRTDFLEKGEERRWDLTFVEEIAEDGILEDGTEITPLKSDNYKETPTAAPKETAASEARTGEKREEVQGKL